MTFLFWGLFAIILAFGFVVFFGAPYVPSRKKHVVDAFKNLYRLKKADTLLDLGAGDGVVLRAAITSGAGRAVGYELNPLLVWAARLLSRRHKGVQISLANMWYTPFPQDTTVVYLFGDARDIGRLTHRIEEEAIRLERVLYVISYGFELPGYMKTKQRHAYHLYEIRPLHSKKPQV